MEIAAIEFLLISILCGVACHNFYKVGIREGADRTINLLHDQKIIAYDNEGQIYPNPFFKKK
tara:strand:+ start:929 stop:1114 length:186 start_codon:yes stop_codon:yes gene_type:complete